MNARRFSVVAPLLLGLSAGGLALSAGSVAASAPSNGCPSGYELLQVQTLSDAGYRVPEEVDSPTSGVTSFGQPGNGDGWVCGVKLGNRLTPFGLPVYNFIDDQLPAS